MSTYYCENEEKKSFRWVIYHRNESDVCNNWNIKSRHTRKLFMFWVHFQRQKEVTYSILSYRCIYDACVLIGCVRLTSTLICTNTNQAKVIHDTQLKKMKLQADDVRTNKIKTYFICNDREWRRLNKKIWSALFDNDSMQNTQRKTSNGIVALYNKYENISRERSDIKMFFALHFSRAQTQCCNVLIKYIVCVYNLTTKTTTTATTTSELAHKSR